MKEITGAEFEQQYADKPGNVLLDVYTVWCGPCKGLVPLLEYYEKKYPKFVFLKMDAEKNVEFCKKYQINCYPFVLFFKDGKPVHEIKGMDPMGVEKKLMKFSA